MLDNKPRMWYYYSITSGQIAFGRLLCEPKRLIAGVYSVSPLSARRLIGQFTQRNPIKGVRSPSVGCDGARRRAVFVISRKRYGGASPHKYSHFPGCA